MGHIVAVTDPETPLEHLDLAIREFGDMKMQPRVERGFLHEKLDR